MQESNNFTPGISPDVQLTDYLKEPMVEPVAAKEISPELARFLEGPPEETLEQKVETLLLSMNRHDRRAWCSRLSRKAGRVRNKALRAKTMTP